MKHTKKRVYIKPGMQFGRLTALQFLGDSRWLAKCECGTEKSFNGGKLTSGHTQSCGCLRAEVAASRLRKHGERDGGGMTPEYRSWKGMIQRCYFIRNKSYHYYGGRGISVCERWRNSFGNFLADMGRKPSAKHSLDRIDNSGNYHPLNCRWATQKEQVANSRPRFTATPMAA